MIRLLPPLPRNLRAEQIVMKKLCSDTARDLRASAKRAGVS